MTLKPHHLPVIVVLALVALFICVTAEADTSVLSDNTIKNNSDNNVQMSASVAMPGLGELASGPCTGSSVGIGIVLIETKWANVDQECDKREAIKILWLLGEHDLARKVAMNLQAVKDATAVKPKEVKSETENFFDHQNLYR